jgi:hypothetical protein
LRGRDEGDRVSQASVRRLQVIRGGAPSIHPEPQTFVADELGGANGFSNGHLLGRGEPQLVLVEEQRSCRRRRPRGPALATRFTLPRRTPVCQDVAMQLPLESRALWPRFCKPRMPRCATRALGATQDAPPLQRECTRRCMPCLTLRFT